MNMVELTAFLHGQIKKSYKIISYGLLGISLTFYAYYLYKKENI